MVTTSLLLNLLIVTAIDSTVYNPFVIDHKTTAVYRKGVRVGLEQGETKITLVVGDEIIPTGKGPGTVYSEDKGVFTLEDSTTRLKFVDEPGRRGNLFYLMDGTISYDSHETASEGGTVEDLGTGRDRLVRTKQRSLGTRGTKFRLTQFDGMNSDTATLSVSEGAVVFPLISEASQGPVYTAPITDKNFHDLDSNPGIGWWPF